MGDVGVLIGVNNNTVERIYWKNKNTFQTADIPSEARFAPSAWGLLRLKEVGTSGVGSNCRFTARGLTVRLGAGTLHIDGMPANASKVCISDLFGRVKVSQKTSGGSVLIPASAFASGLYFVTVSDSRGNALLRMPVTVN
jgi:hypothetical protein